LIEALHSSPAVLTRAQADMVLRLCGWPRSESPFEATANWLDVMHQGWRLRVGRYSGSVVLFAPGGVDAASCTLTVAADHLMIEEGERWAESLREASREQH